MNDDGDDDEDDDNDDDQPLRRSILIHKKTTNQLRARQKEYKYILNKVVVSKNTILEN